MTILHTAICRKSGSDIAEMKKTSSALHPGWRPGPRNLATTLSLHEKPRSQLDMRHPTSLIILTLAFAATACGGRGDATPAGGGTAAEAAPPAAGELTPFELKNGIGPITTEIPAGPLDHAMAERGEKIFEGKCSACHKFTEKYVGPSLGGVTERRTIAYVMNMMLNPEGMYTRHPVAKQLLAEHLTQMPNQGLTQDEAREVAEYLREQSTKHESE
jgi:mono/diheme cytochrome c family protein